MPRVERRGGKRVWRLCEGSGGLPSAVYQQGTILGAHPTDIAERPRGACSVCTKICKLRENGTLPRHKPLSDVVRAWEDD